MAASYEIYVKNFQNGSSVQSAETLFQTIPTDPDKSVFMEPTLKGGIGKAGSFEFTIPSESVYYGGFKQMKTKLRIKYFGKTVFRGRVLTIDDSMFEGLRTVHCEGDFAYFMDSVQEGYEDESRPVITMLQYITELIDIHNAQMDEDDKKFYVGEVPGNYTSATENAQRVIVAEDKNFGNSSWGKTMDRLEDLVDQYGGYFRTRYSESDGKTYLDWLEQYYDSNPNGQSVEVQKNIIDISSETEVDNLFTVVIPVGTCGDKSIFIDDIWPAMSSGHERVNYIEVPELATIPLYPDSELNKGIHTKQDYLQAIQDNGRIYRVVTFENATTAEELFNFAKDWIKNNYIGEINSYDVTAIDLRLVDGQYDPLYVGDLVNLVLYDPDTNTKTTQQLTVISVDKKLLEPGDDNYKIAKPNSIINQVYGNEKKNNGKGGGGGGSPKPSPINTILQQTLYYSSPLAFLGYDVDGTKLTTQQTLDKMKQLLTPDEINDLMTNPKYLTDPNSFINDHMTHLLPEVLFWQAMAKNSMADKGVTEETINALMDQSTGEETALAIAMLVDEQGNPRNPDTPESLVDLAKQLRKNVVLGSDEDIQSNLYQLIKNSHDNGFVSIIGDILSLGGIEIPGLFEIDPETGKIKFLSIIDPESPVTPENLREIFSIDTKELTAVISSDVELTLPEVIKRVKGGVAFGLYDEENLTAGVIVSKINDDSTVTILGDHVQIGSTDAKTAIFDLNASVVNIGGDISSINRTLADQESELYAHGQSITAITTDVNLMGQELTDAQMDIASQGRSITAINTAVTSITSEITTIGGDLTQAQQDILDQAEVLTGHGVSIIALNADITEVSGLLHAAQAKIDTIESNYITANNLAAKIAELGSVSIHGLTASAITTSGSVNIGMGLTVGGTITVNGYGVLTAQHDPLQTFAVTTSGNTITLTWKSIYGNHDGTASFDLAGAVTLSGNWSGNTYTVTASNGQRVSTSLTVGWDNQQQYSISMPGQSNWKVIGVTFETDDWANNKKNYRVKASENGSSHIAIQGIIDATSVYSSGETAGIAAGKAAVTLSSAWSGATYTVTASNGKTASVTLTPSPANASTISTFTNHLAYITVSAPGISGPLFRWTVDATSEWRAGYEAGKAAMGLVRNGNVISLQEGSEIKSFSASVNLSYTNNSQYPAAVGVSRSGSTISGATSSTVRSIKVNAGIAWSQG